jgi:hypothetical protein
VPRWLKLPELTQDGHDIRTECAGTIAGGWFAKPIIMGEALIAAGLLINAGPTDMDLLTRWLSIGFARRGVCGSPMMRAGRSRQIRRSLGAPRPSESFGATPRTRKCRT